MNSTLINSIDTHVGSCQSTGFRFWTYGYYCYLSVYIAILFVFSLRAAQRIKKTTEQPTAFNNLLEMQRMIVSNSYPAIRGAGATDDSDSGSDIGAGADIPNKESIDTNQPLTPLKLSTKISSVKENSRRDEKSQHTRYLKQMSSIGQKVTQK